MAAISEAVTGSSWKNPRLAGRISELDGLRGAAILLVLIFHYVSMDVALPLGSLPGRIMAVTRLFWSGVDLFFLLSGFLIAGILLDSIGSRAYFKTFYMRRIHRIFPVYYLWLLLFLIGVFADIDARLRTPGLFKSTLPLWPYPLFVQNNFMLVCAAPLWMAMSWSLAIEEQFYLLLPSIIRFSSRARLAHLAGGAVLLSPFLRVALVVLLSRRGALPDGWEFFTLSRLDALAMGVGIALMVRDQRCWKFLRVHRTGLRALLMALLCVCAGLTIRRSALVMAGFGFTVIGVLYAVLLVLALAESKSRLATALRTPVLQYLGKVSYAVYILHQGIKGLFYAIALHRLPRVDSVQTAFLSSFALIITFGIAELSWRVIERKAIRRAHNKYAY